MGRDAVPTVVLGFVQGRIGPRDEGIGSLATLDVELCEPEAHRHMDRLPRTQLDGCGLDDGVMGAAGAVNIIFRKQLEESDKPEERRKELVAEYEATFNNPYKAAELGFIDRVIAPADSRKELIASFRMLHNKPRKHGNIPL